MQIPTFNKNMDSKDIKSESENLAVKIFTEICCESCSCKSEQDHKKE